MAKQIVDGSEAGKHRQGFKDGANRFCMAHPDQDWRIVATETQDGLRITISDGYYNNQFTVSPTPDLADSVFDALEQRRVPK
jgi:hypothetical protein